MHRPTIDFWYDFASTYSYLTAVRIADLAAAAGCDVAWRPFLLGPIFKSQGLTTSPFNVNPAKGRYMVRDITRIAATRGRTFRMPATFPAASLRAARLAISVGDERIGAFTAKVFTAAFEDGADIADRALLLTILRALDLDPDAHLALADSDAVKQSLRTNTERAMALGIFGAPTFVTADGELFWGDDRLEPAIAWAVAHPTN